MADIPELNKEALDASWLRAVGDKQGGAAKIVTIDRDDLAHAITAYLAALPKPERAAPGDVEAVVALAARVAKVAPGPWEVDTEKQTDAPDRHNEYILLDARGYRLLGTENCDHRFGEIHVEYDEDGLTAWNEPARVLLEYLAILSPDKIAALATHAPSGIPALAAD